MHREACKIFESVHWIMEPLQRLSILIPTFICYWNTSVACAYLLRLQTPCIAGYSPTGQPLPPSDNSSQPQTPRSPVATDRTGDKTQQKGECATPTSPKPASAVDTLIEGLRMNHLGKDEPANSKAELNQSSSPITASSEPQAASSKVWSF